MSRVICDFCSNREPVWEYPCKDFIAAVPRGDLPALGSEGSWAACTACAALIEEGNAPALFRRSVRVFKENFPLLRDVEITIEQTGQDGFWKHRMGKRKLIEGVH